MCLPRWSTASYCWLRQPRNLPSGLGSCSIRTTRYRWRSIALQAARSATSSGPLFLVNSALRRSPLRARFREPQWAASGRAPSLGEDSRTVSYFEPVPTLATVSGRSASSPMPIWPGPSSAPWAPPRSATTRSFCSSCSRGSLVGNGASSPRDTNSSRGRWTRACGRSATRGTPISRIASRCGRGWVGPALVALSPRSGTGSVSGPRSMAVLSGAGRRSNPRSDRVSPSHYASTIFAHSRTASRDATCRRSS